MNSKLVFFIVIVGTIFVSGCVSTSLDNINSLMPDINSQIENGNIYYNESVVALNNKNYSEADTKANLAIKEYTKAKENVLETNKYFEGVNQTIYIEYLDLVKNEINLKNNASSNILQASKYYKENNIPQGNSYSEIANSKMNEALDIQNERNTLVKENPDLFKEFFYF